MVPKSSCTGAKESCTGAKQRFSGAKDSWKNFCFLGPKRLLHPLLTTLGTFEVSGPCSRHSGSQCKRCLWKGDLIRSFLGGKGAVEVG